MNVQVVYLDQNAASFLAKSNPGQIWTKIREALERAFQEGKLFCPLPFEGIVETAPRPLEYRRATQDLFCQLAGGLAFKAFTEISNELTLRLIRPVSAWSPFRAWEPGWAEREAEAQELKDSWKGCKKEMMVRMEEFLSSRARTSISAREAFNSIMERRSIWICEDLDCLLAGRTSGKLNCPWLIQFLITAKLCPAEVDALKRAVQYHGWATIPIHAFEGILGAQWESDLRNGGAAPYEPNDEIDRMRAAIALDYADLFITEGGIADLCRRSKVQEFSDARVLSVRNPEEILQAISAC